MRMLYGLILGIILFVFFIISYRKTKDLFSPICVFSVIQFIKYVPNIISSEYEQGFYLDEVNTFKVLCYEILVVLSLVLGYIYFNSKKSKRIKQNHSFQQNKSVPLLVILTIYIIGLSSRIYLIYKIGGISFVLNNVAVAYAGLSSGFGYIMALSNLMLISMLMLLDKIVNISNSSWNKKEIIIRKNFYKILMLSMVLTYASTYLLFSSRSPVMEMVMILAFGYNYLKKKYKLINILNPKYLFLTLLLLSIIVVMPILRTSNSMVQPSSGQIVNNLSNSSINIFNEFSTVGRDAFVYDHFNLDNYWFGKVYLNLLVAPIPSSIFSNKPPVDDGVYLNQLMHGYDVSPNLGRENLYFNSSIPFTTQGAMYANFGALGIIISHFLMGMLYARIYKSVIERKDIFIIVIYQLVIYQLELSTLSIIQTLIPLIIIIALYKFVSGVGLYKRKAL